MTTLTNPDTGETYDDARVYTAWELCGDSWWSNLGYVARVVGGRADWEDAANFGGQNVRLQRLEPGNTAPCQFTRYVNPDTRMMLIRTPWVKRNMRELGWEISD